MNTAAPVFVLRIPQYADYRRTIRIRNRETGEYVDLSDYLIELQVRETVKSDTALLSLSSNEPTDDGEITIDGSRALVVIPEEATAVLDFDRGVYDIRFTNYAGVVTRILQGAAVLDRGVTR